MKKYEVTPDYQNIVMAARNQAAPRLPLYEHAFRHHDDGDDAHRIHNLYTLFHL